MWRAIRACALVLMLACSVSAGIMGNDTPQPPPPQPQTPGIMVNGSPEPEPPPRSDGITPYGSPELAREAARRAGASLLLRIASGLLALP